jgi:ribosome-associated protein
MNVNQIIDTILQREVHFHFSRSGGHGGQNVNKVATKAELYFNIYDSQYLTDEQKQRLIKLGQHRVHHEEKILIMTCQEERLQIANKEKVIHHFRQLLNEACVEPKNRISTKVPKTEREARILDKKMIGKTKQLRQSPKGEE